MSWLIIIVCAGLGILKILQWKSRWQQGFDEAEEKYRMRLSEDQKVIADLEKENKRLKMEIAQTKGVSKDGLQ